MGTTTDKLTHLGQTKSEIRDAIISKGVPVPVETTFRGYADKIRDISCGGDIPQPTPYIRPNDWLPINNLVVEGNQKFVGLYAIFEDSNFLSLSAIGDYTVNWGDGTIENFASGDQAYHQYSYDDFVGTESTKGYRQAIITVTPQLGHDLIDINLQKKHNQVGLVSYSTGWLDVTISAPNITSLSIGGLLPHGHLEIFCFLGNNNISSFDAMFYNCYSLQSIPLFNTVSGVSFNLMFANCYSLQSVPLINVVNGTSFFKMFDNCYSLQSVPLFNTINGTNFSSMFSRCSSLQTVPLFNTEKGTDFNNMFSSCVSLWSVPLFNTVNGRSFDSMFVICSSLQTVPLFNTEKGVSFQNMLGSCYALNSVPLFNTINGTSFSSMFGACYSLQSVPLFNTINGTNFSSMFANCYSLQIVPLFNVVNGNSFNNMFMNCPSLHKGSISRPKNTISYASCKLSASAIVDIFNNLASVWNYSTITITNNWGASLLTVEERAIATNKGWMISG